MNDTGILILRDFTDAEFLGFPTRTRVLAITVAGLACSVGDIYAAIGAFAPHIPFRGAKAAA